MARITVRVPATSANLGSGYDSFGLALALHNTVTAGLSDHWDVRVTGPGAEDSALARDNRVAAAMRHVFAEAGRPDQAADVSCGSDIPVGGGLGSSAAAVVSGLVVANELLERPFGVEDLVRMAVAIEGHADNATTALVGGFTMSWHDSEWQFVRIEPAGGLAAVLLMRDTAVATAGAREMLPATVPHADAAFNAGRAGVLATAVSLGRADLLAAGMGDRLHQPYRTAAVPDMAAAIGALIDAGADGAALSGSGPTVIGLVGGVDDGEALMMAEAVRRRAEPALERLDGRSLSVVPIDRIGAMVIADSMARATTLDRGTA